MDQKSKKLLEEKVTESGYVVLKISYREGTLEIMAEKEKYKGMNLGDCEKLSRVLSPFLDAEDLIREPYTLEVTSPGVRRPLICRDDFEYYRGHAIECTNNAAIMYNGVIKAVGTESIDLELQDGSWLRIPLADVASARLLY